MSIVILTSDVLDGKIVCSYLLRQRKDIKAIVYERKRHGMKSLLKLLCFFLLKRIDFLFYKEVARKKPGLKVMVTDTVNSSEVSSLLDEIVPHFIVVVGTRKIKREIYTKAKGGAINLHTGILPFYRGADSEYWALFNHEYDKIGVTIHYINDTLDGGDIILRTRQEVRPTDTYKALKLRNLYLGAQKINEAIEAICHNTVAVSRQDSSLSTLYTSKRYGRSCSNYNGRVRKFSRPVIKEFGFAPCRVRERVTRCPTSAEGPRTRIVPRELLNRFCLRIDADTCHDNFSSYVELFSRYSHCITVFFCVSSFLQHKGQIRACKEAGLDVQSHGFYHHTYGDIRSNIYNVRKAQEVFGKLGVETRGYASPMGHYTPTLMEALESQGYDYSSDFSFDYLSYPHYPPLRKRFSRILQIPVFPVSPELFFYRDISSADALSYYKQAIIEIKRCNLPVIIYAHTSHFSQNIPLLAEILEFALGQMGLSPVTMTQICGIVKYAQRSFDDSLFAKITVDVPHLCFLGEEVPQGAYEKLKSIAKDILDFERHTPDKELQCNRLKKMAKIFLRRVR